MIKTAKDLIKILPLPDDFRKELLEKYDMLDESRKYNIGRMVWAAYDTVFEARVQKNLAIALEEAANNREKLDSEFYNRVRDLTEKEMNQVTADEIQEAELDITRDKLAEIISDKTS